MLQQTLQGDINPPGEGQHIVMAIGSRGGNQIEVEYPDGRRTLCLLPARFHKKVWIKRGGYLIIQVADDVTDAAITGQIEHVLNHQQVKSLKKLKDVWPEEFTDRENIEVRNGLPNAEGANMPLSSSDDDDDDDEDEDADLPPLLRVQNRRYNQAYDEEQSSDSD